MKLKRKILWLELWKIEEQEAWFSYLATKGYVLKQVTKLYAIFAKEQPQNITYKIAVDTTTQKPSDLTISEYKQLSWEYVASRGNLHIYKNGSSNDSFPAINQISSLKKLRKKLKVRTVAILCLSILIIILQTYMMVIEPIKNYTEDAFLSPLFIISIFILVNIQMWSGVKHLGKLIVEADTNNLLVNKAVYKRSYYMNKAIGIIICISFTFLIFHTSSLVKTVFTHQYPPIPAGKLPIITIVDIMDDSLRNITVEDNGSYFKESSSLIVPIQYELRQEFFLDADRESSMLFSKKYQLISEFLTKSFTQQLLKYHEGNGQYQKINDDFFHDLYVSESQLYDTYSVIARKDKQVYVVIFNGEVTIDALIEAVKQNTE